MSLRRAPLARRQELARTAPLEPGRPWGRSVPLTGTGIARAREPKRKNAATGRGGSSSGKLIPAPPHEFTPRVRLLVRKRAGRGDVFEALCEACGAHLGEKGGEFQHRAARGAGGCKDEIVNGPANAVLLCGSGVLRTGCHGACEDRDPHMGMDEAGFWVKHGTTPEFDPRNVAIMLHGAGGGGLVVWLGTDGRYLFRSPLEVAA